MAFLRKWRRIYRTARIMAQLDMETLIYVNGSDLDRNLSEVTLDIVGYARTDRIKPYVHKITTELEDW